MEKSYNVLDVARYIINYENDNNYGISNLKLQKILYFIQAAFFKIKGKECFKEEMEAWDFGPVVPEVYHEFKMYGGNDIPYIREYIDYSNGIWEAEKKVYDDNIIDDKDKEIIDGMIDTCSIYSARELVSKTHEQEPWINAYVKGCNNIITKGSIENFFTGE